MQNVKHTSLHMSLNVRYISLHISINVINGLQKPVNSLQLKDWIIKYTSGLPHQKPLSANNLHPTKSNRFDIFSNLILIFEFSNHKTIKPGTSHEHVTQFIVYVVRVIYVQHNAPASLWVILFLFAEARL